MELIREKILPFFKRYWPQFIITKVFIIGLIGFLIPSIRQDWAYLTSFSLIVSLFILVYHHKPKSTKFYWSLFISGIIGFIIEVIGVKTGQLFGIYTYGNKLGFKLFEVPLMLAVNWALLLYLTHYLARKISTNLIIVALIGALLMVGMDFLIEPFAIYFDLWQWKNIHVPLQNYAMWFIASFVLHLYFGYSNSKLSNAISNYIFVTLMLFFLAVNVLVIWT